MKKDKEYFPWKLLIGVILLVIGFWASTWILSYHYLTNWSDRADFGNMFDSVNTLFSGVAMVGIIVAIFLQKKDLAIQREDLRLQRDELAQTRKEFETQNETLKKQRFENTFFHLLQCHLTLKERFKSNSHAVFNQFLIQYKSTANEIVTKKREKKIDLPVYGLISNIEDLENVIIDAFRKFHDNQTGDLPNARM
jgi:formyltetrahydrofolate hydrolase